MAQDYDIRNVDGLDVHYKKGRIDPKTNTIDNNPHVAPNQPQWQAIATNKTLVTIKVVNLAFKKHFAMKSRKEGTDEEYGLEKTKKNLRNRFLLTTAAKNSGEAPGRSEQERGKKVYGMGTFEVHQIDLSKINLKTALKEIADALLKDNRDGGDIEITFSTECVIHAKSNGSEITKENPVQMKITGTERINKIGLHFKRIGDNSFEIG